MTEKLSKPITKIAIDVMGGDYAPYAFVDALEAYLEDVGDIDFSFLLFGDKKAKDFFSTKILLPHKSVFCVCGDVLSNDARPTEVMRASKDYSLRRAVKAVADGEAEAVFTSGSTGGYMVASKLLIGVLDGVERPCLAAMWPTKKGFAVIADLGANFVSSAMLLAQHAVLSAGLYDSINPGKDIRLAILNVGTEDVKGHQELYDAKKALMGLSSISQVFYAEASSILEGSADVYITDGFSGNILLKGVEGAVKFTFSCIKSGFCESILGKCLLFLAKPFLKKGFKIVRPEEYNAALLLGLASPAIKIHGGSDVGAIKQGLILGLQMINVDMNAKLKRNIEELRSKE